MSAIVIVIVIAVVVIVRVIFIVWVGVWLISELFLVDVELRVSVRAEGDEGVREGLALAEDFEDDVDGRHVFADLVEDQPEVGPGLGLELGVEDLGVPCALASFSDYLDVADSEARAREGCLYVVLAFPVEEVRLQEGPDDREVSLDAFLDILGYALVLLVVVARGDAALPAVHAVLNGDDDVSYVHILDLLLRVDSESVPIQLLDTLLLSIQYRTDLIVLERRKSHLLVFVVAFEDLKLFYKQIGHRLFLIVLISIFFFFFSFFRDSTLWILIRFFTSGCLVEVRLRSRLFSGLPG